MSTPINVKVNRKWLQIESDSSPWTNEPCAYRTGTGLYDLFEVPDGHDLWRECDDGHDDELIRDVDDAANTITLWDGDRFYTFERKIL